MDAELADLAEAYGVATSYEDWRHEDVAVPDATVVRVLAALGVDASTPDAVHRALAERRLAGWRRVLPLIVVTRAGSGALVRVHAPASADTAIELRLEDGTVRRKLFQLLVHVEPVEVDGVSTAESTYGLPTDLPCGWHTLVVRYDGHEAAAPVAVAPAFLGVPGDLRTWGLTVQLYSTRSRGSWGIGDLGDLRTLARWSGDHGAGFLLVNPLHASAPVPPREPSPYFPATRRFPDPLYLRIEDVPEYAALPADRRETVDALGEPASRTNADPGGIDRDLAWRQKRAALEVLYEAGLDGERRVAYEAFRDREGAALDDFATWCALCEEYGPRWRDWPDAVRDARSRAVDEERDRLAGRVEFHRWLQWLTDEQLAATQHAATDAGMPLGVLHDLAVGVSPDGADAWSAGDVLAAGVTVGAPPDGFNQQGQDWRQPPWHPVRLAEAGYAPYRDMVRAVLRHAGGVRIDHVIGLFRLWWIPDGRSPADGTYVRYDADAMLGILALEAYRAGAVVVGEDLGTVEESARDALADRGVLGTSVLWFERDDAGRVLPRDSWRELALATVTTHDLPTAAGYLAGEHVDLRHRLGLLTRPVEVERAAHDADRTRLLEALRAAGLLGDNPSEEQVIEALHAYVATTPARLVGVALPDTVGDRRTQNQPGTVDAYPNWRVPLTDANGEPVLLEDLQHSTRAHRLLYVVSASLTHSSTRY
ncbi:MAG: 4-alpha-glucanotransferase [Streptosporangiales bacterium]